MKKKILIVYASKYGASTEIADKIADELRQSGLQVDLVPAKTAKYLEPYGAVIIGTAAYMFRWRSEAVSFLKNNENVLSNMPVWIFSSGPLGKGDPVELSRGQLYPRALQPLISRIKPRDVAVFHGSLDMAKLNFFERFMFRRAIDVQGDFRDWNMISSWAKTIAGSLRSESD